MRKKRPAFVISFDETTQAMAMDRFCTQNGLPGRLIPVPREITAGCGLAWKAEPKDEPVLMAVLEKEGIAYSSTYMLEL